MKDDPMVGPQAAAMERIQKADDSLTARIENLRKTLGELTPEVSKLQQDQRTTFSWLKGGAGFIAFDVFVTVAGLLLGFHLHSVTNQNHNLIEQVQQNQARLDTSIHETCHVYGTFIGFYSDAAKSRFAGGPAQYDQLYIQLQQSSDRLNCGIKHVVPGT
jgi:hypothetical protein